MPLTPIFLFTTQLLTTLFMTGLIWFVQIVHYPLFTEVGPDHLARYETLHAQRTTWVVFPPMLLELLTTLATLYPPLRPAFLNQQQAIVLTVLIAIIWITTGLAHVPLHTRLGQSAPVQQCIQVITLLVRLNWIRTLAWTTRALLLTTVLLHALHSR